MSSFLRSALSAGMIAAIAGKISAHTFGGEDGHQHQHDHHHHHHHSHHHDHHRHDSREHSGRKLLRNEMEADRGGSNHQDEDGHEANRINFTINGREWADSDEFVRSGHSCGTVEPSPDERKSIDERMRQVRDKKLRLMDSGRMEPELWNKKLADRYGSRRRRLRTHGDSSRYLISSNVITVKVHWHIFRKDLTTAGGNLSQASIDEQMRVINSAFAGEELQAYPRCGWVADQTALNDPAIDLMATPFRFDVESLTYYDDPALFSGVDEGSYKSQLRRGDCGELNIYTGDSAYLGFGVFPYGCDLDISSGSKQDGIVLDYTVLPGITNTPYSEGDTLTHELGHWFGLYHTFQDGCYGGDQIGDTAPEASSAGGCPVGRNTCSGDSVNDPIHNFMDYTDDCCMFRFSPDQVEAMVDQATEYRRLGPDGSPTPPPSPSPSRQACAGTTVRVEITTDLWPAENTWTITDAAGLIIDSGGPYATAESTYSQNVCIESDGSYTFTIEDLSEDGICCEHGKGGYEVFVDEFNVVSVPESGDFEASASVEFQIGTEVPTHQPSPIPTHAPSPIPTNTPSPIPSKTESSQPSIAHSSAPSRRPISSPPTRWSSSVPSQTVSSPPSIAHSSVPSETPTSASPTKMPNSVPSQTVSSPPSIAHSLVPSAMSTSASPTKMPSSVPSQTMSSTPPVPTFPVTDAPTTSLDITTDVPSLLPSVVSPAPSVSNLTIPPTQSTVSPPTASPHFNVMTTFPSRVTTLGVLPTLSPSRAPTEPFMGPPQMLGTTLESPTSSPSRAPTEPFVGPPQMLGTTLESPTLSPSRAPTEPFVGPFQMLGTTLESPTSSPSRAPTEPFVGPFQMLGTTTPSPSRVPTRPTHHPPSVPPPPPPPQTLSCTDVTVEIVTDAYPSETTWNIKNSMGSIVARGGPYSQTNKAHTETTCLEDDYLTFKIVDLYGDGLCCTYGNGSYSVSIGDRILANGDQFGRYQSSSFYTSNTLSGLSPTKAPTSRASQTNSSSGSSQNTYLSGPSDFVLDISTDWYGGETTWAAYRVDSGVLIEKGGPYSTGKQDTIHYTKSLSISGCYVFGIFDTNVDGICCSYGEGSYAVTFDGTTRSGGTFRGSEFVMFGEGCGPNAHIDESRVFSIFEGHRRRTVEEIEGQHSFKTKIDMNHGHMATTENREKYQEEGQVFYMG